MLKPILNSSLHHLGAVHASLRALQSERWHLRGQCPTAWHPSRARTLPVTDLGQSNWCSELPVSLSLRELVRPLRREPGAPL